MRLHLHVDAVAALKSGPGADAAALRIRVCRPQRNGWRSANWLLIAVLIRQSGIIGDINLGEWGDKGKVVGRGSDPVTIPIKWLAARACAVGGGISHCIASG